VALRLLFCGRLRAHSTFRDDGKQPTGLSALPPQSTLCCNTATQELPLALNSMSGDEDEPSTQFGSQTPFAEPSWYDSSKDSPYYNEHHVKFRNKIRKFVDDEIIPFVDDWEEAGEIPGEVYRRASEIGLLPAMAGWPDGEQHQVCPQLLEICAEVTATAVVLIRLIGMSVLVSQGWPARPEHFDGFFTVIAGDELARCAHGGIFWGLVGGMGIGLPPVLHSDNEELRERILGPVLEGKKRIALAVSEPDAGSDVAGLKTTAKDMGDYYLVNGMKKWITCGMFADYFSTAVRTGDPDSGMFGLDLILIERTMPGVSTRAMHCMGVRGSGTAYVEFDNVKVPKSNYIGGITMLLQNFVTERLGLAIQANRFARICLAESIE